MCGGRLPFGDVDFKMQYNIRGMDELVHGCELPHFFVATEALPNGHVFARFKSIVV
jgi:hypothetical protein